MKTREISIAAANGNSQYYNNNNSNNNTPSPYKRKTMSEEQSQEQKAIIKDDDDKPPKVNQRRRFLAAFDFDYTIVTHNSDTIIRDLLPMEKYPEDLNSTIDNSGWTIYMSIVFQVLHENNVNAEKIYDTIRSIPEVPGFARLIKRLQQTGDFDMIIISDSNSVFINEWLRSHGLADCFKGIYTNPAQFEESGLLTIRPYHHQTDCTISSANLCKGKILEHFLIEQDLRHNLRYECVIYAGDGSNDICPVLRLHSCDIACVRSGYPMEKNLKKNQEKLKVRAEVIIWKNGFDLYDQLETALDKKKPTECKAKV